MTTDGFLHYYLDIAAAVPAKSVKVSQALAIRSGVEETPPSGWPIGTNPEAAFCVVLTDRTFYFWADSTHEASAWMQSIREIHDTLGAQPLKEGVDLFRGHLFKLGNSYNPSWRERYCILAKTGKLYYFANKQKDDKPLGVIDAADILAVYLGEKEAAPNYGYPDETLGFAVYTAARTFYFYCHSQADRTLWVNWLSRASQSGWERRVTMSMAQRPKPQDNEASPGQEEEDTKDEADEELDGIVHGIAPSLVMRTGFLTKQVLRFSMVDDG